MKVLKRDLRGGYALVKTECLDDLWYLSQLVEAGDLVKTRTVRRIKDKDDSVRSSGGERKTITLAVRLDRVEFQPETDMLRLGGIIEEGPEDIVSIGSHHTFNVDTDTTLTIVKDSWSESSVNQLKEAEKSSMKANVLIAVLDRGEATMGLVRQSGVRFNEVNYNVGGKYDESSGKKDSESFYIQVKEALERTDDANNLSAIIIAGPGFEKEKFRRFLEDKSSKILSKVVVDSSSMPGRSGVEEVLKRDNYAKIVDDLSSARDMKLIDKVLQEIGKDSGLAVYGPADVESAVNSGAVDVLLVLDKILMEDRARIDGMIRNVKSMQGKFHVVNSASDAGKSLASLGGMTAILRYKIS
ncbi:MAG TPA: mRNA surveillance protein pelota [Candidatus Altiarchaeales archaeon]|nr:mRNA surveillance protein pelota [Candidatus Altiarchaeales archaeon]